MAFHGHHPRSTKKLYSAEEAAACLGISKTYLYRLAKSGQIGSVKAGARRLFRPSDLDSWVQGLPPAWPDPAGSLSQTSPPHPDAASAKPPSGEGVPDGPAFGAGPAAREEPA